MTSDFWDGAYVTRCTPDMWPLPGAVPRREVGTPGRPSTPFRFSREVIA